MPKVIAVLGMPGSGKSEAIEFLQSRYQWPKVYFGDVTFNEMKRRGLDRNQANERLVREDLRNIHGDDYYAQEVIKMIEGLGEAPIVLVESLYSGDEYRVLKHHFGDDFATIAIHARPKLRHERLLSRPERPLSLQESEERDWAQLNRLTQGTPIALSDYMVINQGSREELQANLEQAVKNIMNS